MPHPPDKRNGNIGARNSTFELINLYNLNAKSSPLEKATRFRFDTNHASKHTINNNNNGTDHARFDSICVSSVETNCNDLNSMSVNHVKKSSNLKLTLMLLSFPISYLLSTCPIFSIISFKLIDFYFKLDKSYNYEIAFALARILMYINNSINILMFILFGKSLRKDFLKILPFKKFKNQRKRFIFKGK